ncbi:hypothetical protein Tco_0144097 [Tanacetum coccineum]
MESVKKSIGERAQHKMEYESRISLKAKGQNQIGRLPSCRIRDDCHDNSILEQITLNSIMKKGDQMLNYVIDHTSFAAKLTDDKN